MKKRIWIPVLVLFISFILFSCGSKAKIDTVENFTETVVKAVMLNNPDLFKQCLLNESDLDYLLPIVNMPKEKEAEFRKEFKEEFLPEMMKNLTEVREAAIKDGVDNLNYTITEVKYEIKMDDGVEVTDIYVTITSNNTTFALKLDGVKGKKGWKLGDHMVWRGPK